MRSILKLIWSKKGITPINDLIYQVLYEKERHVLQQELKKLEYDYLREKYLILSAPSSIKTESVPKGSLPASTPKPDKTREKASSEGPAPSTSSRSEEPRQEEAQVENGTAATVSKSPATDIEVPSTARKQAQLPTPRPSQSPSPVDSGLPSEAFKNFMRNYCKRNNIASPRNMDEDQRTDANTEWKNLQKEVKASFDFD
jgi:hypothetical protein